MVIVCPTCSSKFSVPDGALVEGKMVRCTVCQTTWQPEVDNHADDTEVTENAVNNKDVEEKVDEPIKEKPKKIVVKTKSRSILLHFAFFFTVATSVFTYLFLSTTYISGIPRYFDYMTKKISNNTSKDTFKLSNVSHNFIKRNDGLYLSITGVIENISKSLKPTPYLSINLRTYGEEFANYTSPETFINETWAEKIDAKSIAPRSNLVFETEPRKVSMNDLMCTIKVGKNI